MTINKTAKKISTGAKTVDVRLGDLRVPEALVNQREHREDKSDKIAQTLDPRKLARFTVVKIDGVMWLYDGQHRWFALQKYLGDGWQDFWLEVDVFTGLDQQQAADLFLGVNDQLAVAKFDKHKVAITAGHEVESGVHAVLTDLGISLERASGRFKVTAVAALEQVFKLGQKTDADHPGDLLHTTLSIILGAYDGYSIEGDLIHAVAKVVQRYRAKVDPDKLAKALNTQRGGRDSLEVQADAFRSAFDLQKRDALAAALVQVYNKRNPRAVVAPWVKVA